MAPRPGFAPFSTISKGVTLLPGDVISCGNNVGAGALRDGEQIEITFDGVGTLSNTLQGGSKPGDTISGIPRLHAASLACRPVN